MVVTLGVSISFPSDLKSRIFQPLGRSGPIVSEIVAHF